MAAPLLRSVHHWYCPDCQRRLTTDSLLKVPWHQCPRHGGLGFALLPEGVKAKVTAHEREDYIGKELVQTDENGRPVTSITTERDDGQDAVVYAPTARAGA